MLIEDHAFGQRQTSTRTGSLEAPDPGAPDQVQDHLQRVDAMLLQRLQQLTRDWWATVPDSVQHAEHPVGGRRWTSAAEHTAPVIDLPQQLTDVIAAGGKRLRPTLSFLGFWASGGDPDSGAVDELTTVGTALELLHTFALVQDDVMDESLSRRGRPTVHVDLARLHRDFDGRGDHDRFGESMAVLLGDLAHAESGRLVSECSPEVRRRWHQLIIELINGQVRDLTGSSWRDADPERALLIARLKSGSYTIQRPLELGAVIAGATTEEIELLTEYGRELGTAFALRDDVLGVWGDPAVTGKPAGDDLAAGKPTMIIALAISRLGHLEVLQRIGTPSLSAADIGILQQAIDDCGVRSEVEAMIDDHLARALTALDRFTERGPAVADAEAPVEALTRLAHQVARRDR